MKPFEVQTIIGCEATQVALQAAVDRAAQEGVKINVAAVDAAGNLAGFLRMPGAPLHSIDIAIDKAYTAASFSCPTGDWDQILANGSVGFREGIVQRPRFTPFGGGMPIWIDRELIGAIGVSGASEAQDVLCAEAALASIGADQLREAV